MKTFNKRGDSGQTSLLYGGRVSKCDSRCEAYGTIDEAVSALGIARNFVTKPRSRELIFKVQKELFIIGGEIATKIEEYDKLTTHFKPVTDAMVDELEAAITDLEAKMEMPKAFIIPGGNPGSSFLDLARAIIRRAERKAVTLKEENEIKNEAILRYLNRLADLLFTLARYEES